MYIFNCYNSNVIIFQNLFCTQLNYVLLEGKIFPPPYDTYPLNIYYCCPLTEAEYVTKDCASRRSPLQSGQTSLRKCV